MVRTHKGLTIAREILLVLTFFGTAANVILMIVQLCLLAREARGYIKIKDSDEIPF